MIIATVDRNDRRDRNFSVSAIAKITECMFPYARKDRSDRCDRCDGRAAIVAIIWKPGLKTKVCLFSPDSTLLSQVYCPHFNSKGDERDSHYKTICQNLKRKVVNNKQKSHCKCKFPLKAQDLY